MPSLTAFTAFLAKMRGVGFEPTYTLSEQVLSLPHLTTLPSPQNFLEKFYQKG